MTREEALRRSIVARNELVQRMAAGHDLGWMLSAIADAIQQAAHDEAARYVEALRPLATINDERQPDFLRLLDVNGSLHVPGLEKLELGHCRAAAKLVREFDETHQPVKG